MQFKFLWNIQNREVVKRQSKFLITFRVFHPRLQTPPKLAVPTAAGRWAPERASPSHRAGSLCRGPKGGITASEHPRGPLLVKDKSPLD